MRPFAIESRTEFRPEPPPALDSEEWAADYNEVKRLGSAVSERLMGPLSASITAFGVSSVLVKVGQGVFLKARVMSCNVETPAMVIAAWIVAGFLTLAGALTLAELAAMMPESGGIYVFLREAYGARWEFLYGWMNFFIGGVSLSTGGAAFAIFLNVVTGAAFSGEIFAFDFAGVKASLRATQLVDVKPVSSRPPSTLFGCRTSSA